MKKSRRQLEEEQLAEEEQRAQRKERRRRAREALERDELADEVAAGSVGAAAAAVALRARGGFFEEERQGMEEVDLGPGASLSLSGAPSAPLYSSHFLRRFACVAALGVALTCGAASSWRRNNPLPRFELGSSSLVAIRSLDSSKAYLQLSTQDGLLRASASSKDEVGAVVASCYLLLLPTSGTKVGAVVTSYYSPRRPCYYSLLTTHCLLPASANEVGAMFSYYSHLYFLQVGAVFRVLVLSSATVRAPRPATCYSLLLTTTHYYSLLLTTTYRHVGDPYHSLLVTTIHSYPQARGRPVPLTTS